LARKYGLAIEKQLGAEKEAAVRCGGLQSRVECFVSRRISESRCEKVRLSVPVLSRSHLQVEKYLRRASKLRALQAIGLWAPDGTFTPRGADRNAIEKVLGVERAQREPLGAAGVRARGHSP
jgi:hypothetical protein